MFAVFVRVYYKYARITVPCICLQTRQNHAAISLPLWSEELTDHPCCVGIHAAHPAIMQVLLVAAVVDFIIALANGEKGFR